MTKDHDFKALVRERMAKTGESYAAARANLRGERQGPAGAPRRFTIPVWPMTGPIAQLGASIGDPTVERYVDVTDDEVVVHMSADTRCVLPRDAIVDVQRCDGLAWVTGLRRERKVHILYGGGGSGVAVRLDRDVDILVAGESQPLRELRIGVDDAGALADALRRV